MFKRLFWFALGAAAGVFGLRYVRDAARRTGERLSPEELFRDVKDGVSTLVGSATDYLRNRTSDEVLDKAVGAAPDDRE
jgi:hypothetical protein